VWVLGVNLSHDRSVCLMRDGEVVVAIEEERLDRIKHSEGFLVKGYFERLSKVIPMKSITYCLDTAGIGIDDLDLVVGNRPLNDGSARRLLRDLPIKDKSKICELPMPSHHLAHAYSGYFASPFDDAAVLVVDGVGSRIPGSNRIEKHTIYSAEGTKLSPIRSLSYAPDYSDVGLGLLYEFFTAKLGFTTKWGNPSWGSFSCGGYLEAGKTMGLAPYGRPRPDWEPLLQFDGDDVSVTMSALEDAYRRWYAQDGDGYDPAEPDSFDSQFARDIARKVQDEIETAMVYLAQRVREVTGARQLCLSGGVALNSVANQQVNMQALFDDIYILPPAGDGGVCIGTAAYGYYEMLGGTKRHHLASAAVGRGYPDHDILDALRDAHGKVEYRAASLDEVAGLLAAHKVVGWFQGGSEMGPRALGQRSMLADPRHPEMRDYLNVVVKHREVFRPYAPSVLAEHAADWFALRGPSPFMLLVPPVLAHLRDRVPAITHVDGTARVQTVTAELNAPYYELISGFHRRTGVPMVLNTSFNDAGEPIVETPADAVRAFLNTELDYLYIGSYLVSKPGRRVPAAHPANRPLAVG
jgi:carbamoyltransferase